MYTPSNQRTVKLNIVLYNSVGGAADSPNATTPNSQVFIRMTEIGDLLVQEGVSDIVYIYIHILYICCFAWSSFVFGSV